VNIKKNMSEINHEAYRVLKMLEEDCIYMDWTEKNKLERAINRILKWSGGE
jgi:hypothetical protein